METAQYHGKNMAWESSIDLDPTWLPYYNCDLGPQFTHQVKLTDPLSTALTFHDSIWDTARIWPFSQLSSLLRVIPSGP